MKASLKRVLSLVLCLVLVVPLVTAGFIKSVQIPASAATQNQINIAARADYLYSLTWTCQKNVSCRAYNTYYTFYKGNTYHMPYGQGATSYYIGYGVSPENFVAAANNVNSIFYSQKSYSGSWYSTYYISDCSGFVSWCWGLSVKQSTRSLGSYSSWIGSVTYNNIVNYLQIGDALNRYDYHVVLVSDIFYDSYGNMTGIEITEQTIPQTKRTVYTPSGLASAYASYDGIYRYYGNVPQAPYQKPDISTSLDGHEPIDLGKDFYAYVRQPSTGRYMTHKNGNVYVRQGIDDNANQLWHFIRQENGSYSIGLDGTTLWMDVTNENYSDGTNIRMYQGNGSYSQKFFIYYINGRFVLRAMYNNKVVDVENGGDNVHLWGDTAGDVGSIAYDARGLEILKLNMDDTKVNTCIGWDFPCYIRHKETGMLLTAVGDNALFQYPAYSEDQKWNVTRNEYGGHVIKSMVSGKVLDVAGGSLDILTNIDLYEPNGSKAQTFFVIPQGYSSYCYIKPSYTNTLMSIDGTTGEVYSYAFGNTDDLRAQQQFEFITEDHIGGDEVLRTSVYMGESFTAQLHPHGATTVLTDHGETVSMDENTQAKNQYWTFTYDSDTNAYKITGNSGKVFDSEAGGYKNSTKMVLSESTDSISQRFRFYETEYGYIISPIHTQKLVDVATDGTTVQLYRSTVDTSRMFDLTVVSYNGLKPLDFGDSFTSAIENFDSGLYITESNSNPISCTDTPSEWTFTRKSSGAYTITNAVTGNSLNVENGYIYAGSNLRVNPTNGTRGQDFFIYHTENGYVLMSAKSVNVLDMSADTKKLHVYGWGDSDISVSAHSFNLPGAPMINELMIKAGSPLVEEGVFLRNLSAGMTAAQVLEHFDNVGAVVCDAEGNQIEDDALCGTGYSVHLMISGRSVDSVQIVVAGDIDGNGKINATDYLRVKAALLGNYKPEEAFFLAADTDRSGVVDTTDYMRIRSYFLGNYDLYA